MPFTDPRLPGKEYKTERGLKSALRALEKREARAQAAAEGTMEHAVAHQEPEQPQEPYSGPIFLRNLRHVPVRLRFGGKEGRSVKLEPRGARGDFCQLMPGEEYDPQLNDVGLLFEALTDAQIATVLQGQLTNQQSVHPALAHLRTPTGEQYQGGVVIQEEHSQQGVTVGMLVDKGPSEKNQQRTEVERIPQSQIDVAVGPARAKVIGTQDRPIPQVSSAIGPEEQAQFVAASGGIGELMRRDALARSQDSLAAGLGGLRPAGLAAPQGDVAITSRGDDGQINPADRTPAAPVTGQENL